jgi:hypothetical protein
VSLFGWISGSERVTTLVHAVLMRVSVEKTCLMGPPSSRCLRGVVGRRVAVKDFVYVEVFV